MILYDHEVCIYFRGFALGSLHSDIVTNAYFALVIGVFCIHLKSIYLQDHLFSLTMNSLLNAKSSMPIISISIFITFVIIILISAKCFWFYLHRFSSERRVSCHFTVRDNSCRLHPSHWAFQFCTLASSRKLPLAAFCSLHFLLKVYPW